MDTINNQEYENVDYNDRLNQIIEHIQKPKKLALPKGYLRPRNTFVDCLDIQDNLDTEPIHSNGSTSDIKESNTTLINILEPSESVKKDGKKAIKKANEKKTRNPTAYNIFVKETVVKLIETHQHLTPKERFKLAIAMWSENKNKS